MSNPIDTLIRDLNSGIILISTEHQQVRANVLYTESTPTVSCCLRKEKADFVLLSRKTRVYFKYFKLLNTASFPWFFPVGNEEHPPRTWYAATLHDLTGAKNNGYRHTGIDLNLDLSPWGDVDQGQPVFAVTQGVITAKAHSSRYLSSIVLLVDHEGQPLYVRYWHLANNDTFQAYRIGQQVAGGQLLGHLGDYTPGAGGDHLHFDMALDPFEPLWWFTRHTVVRWIDPVPVLEAHLDNDQVQAMLARG